MSEEGCPRCNKHKLEKFWEEAQKEQHCRSPSFSDRVRGDRQAACVQLTEDDVKFLGELATSTDPEKLSESRAALTFLGIALEDEFVEPDLAAPWLIKALQSESTDQRYEAVCALLMGSTRLDLSLIDNLRAALKVETNEGVCKTITHTIAVFERERDFWRAPDEQNS